MQITLSAVSGLFVGFSLGLIGGGGSILAVPLLLYFVGLQEVPDAVHIAVGSRNGRGIKAVGYLGAKSSPPLRDVCSAKFTPS